MIFINFRLRLSAFPAAASLFLYGTSVRTLFNCSFFSSTWYTILT